jgi:hypothetical protein
MKTIKGILWVAFTMLASYTLQAQLSVQAGVNVASWRAEFDGVTVETDSKPGFAVGVTYSTPVSDKFNFRPGLMYTQKGAKLFGFETSQNYLELPLSFVYQSNPMKGFFAEGGPYIGFLLSADSDGEDVKDDFSSTDVGLNLGVGWDFGKLMVGVRGGIGISNLAKNDGTADEGKITNSNGQLWFGVKF